MVHGIDTHPQPESHDFNVSRAATSSATSKDGCINEQDHQLPIANVGRIMKRVLPPNAKISKEAKETMQECVSEFIGFITGEASHRCRKERRKTINGDDICCAMKTLGLDEYADATLRYLHKYREHGEKANSMKQDKSIQIDVRDELSVHKSLSPHNSEELEIAKRFL